MGAMVSAFILGLLSDKMSENHMSASFKWMSLELISSIRPSHQGSIIFGQGPEVSLRRS